MTIYEDKMIVTKVAIKQVCDICAKESNSLNNITMRHTNWGNDSIESIKNIEICWNSDCYKKAVIVFLNDTDYNYNNSFFDEINIEDIRAIASINSEEIK